nr:aldo/keto reductase [Streptomyces europaeiscabiei]
MTGRFVSADRDHFVLATKFTLGAAPQPGISTTGNSRKIMVASVEASLRRLGTDCIDLLWVHFPDELTPWKRSCAGWMTW